MLSSSKRKISTMTLEGRPITQRKTSREGGMACVIPLKKNQEQFLPLKPFHDTVEKLRLYTLLDERRQEVTRLYFTTEATQGDLKSLAGVTTTGAVRYLILTSIEQLWEYLPPDVKQEYKSPKHTLLLKSGFHVPDTRRKIGEVRTGQKIGSREFSKRHKDNLSVAASRRWQRYREQKVQKQAAKKKDQS